MLSARTGREVIEPFFLAQLKCMKFQLLIKTKMLINFFAFKLSDVVIIMLIYVKMPKIVDILTFMSLNQFMVS